MSEVQITPKQLLELKAGMKLLVRHGKKFKEVIVKERPYLSASGQPGPGRVRIWCFDASRMPKTVSDELNSFFLALDNKAVFEVKGSSVIKICV